MTRALETVHRLRALTVELDQLAGTFARLNHMHATDVRALICLLDADRAGIVATPGWLGSQLGINSASVTALIDRMERYGHVARARDDTDRRRVKLTVTPAATELGWQYFGPVIAGAVAEIDRFSPADHDAIDKFLEIMHRVVGSIQSR